MSRFDEDEATIPCPNCKREIHEDSQQCPGCGHYLTDEDELPRSHRPWWLILGVLVCLYAVYRWIVG